MIVKFNDQRYVVLLAEGAVLFSLHYIIPPVAFWSVPPTTLFSIDIQICSPQHTCIPYGLFKIIDKKANPSSELGKKRKKDLLSLFKSQETVSASESGN